MTLKLISAAACGLVNDEDHVPDELPARDGYTVEGCDCAATVAALRCEVQRLRKRIDGQTDYSIALQQLIESLAHGRPLPDVRTQAPHLFDLATIVQAERISLRQEKAHLVSMLDMTDRMRLAAEDAADATPLAKRAAVLEADANGEAT